MLKESFNGKRPSQYSINPFVKSFIVSETFLWSAWNFVMPIFAVFVSNHIAGGSVEVAATSFSAYLIVRVISELASGQLLAQKKINLYLIIVTGMVLMSIAYLGFAVSSTILSVYLFYVILGIGIGIASPAKNSMFASHLDKDRAPTEWGIHDASVFMGMALAAALGGFIANKYGFSVLFVMAAIINFLGTVPYMIFTETKTQPSLLTMAGFFLTGKPIQDLEENNN